LSSQSAELVDTAGQTILYNATVVDGSQASPGLTIRIDDGFIRSVDRSDPAPSPGERLVDVGGRFVTPGFIDAHVHLTGVRNYDPYHRYLAESRDVRLVMAMRDMDIAFRAGFTGMRDLGVGGLGGALRDIVESGAVIGPRLASPHEAISHTGGPCDWPFLPEDVVALIQPRGQIVDGVDACRSAVRANFRNGATLTKIMVTSGNLAIPQLRRPREIWTDEELQALVEEGHKHGGPVAAHCMGSNGVRRAVLAGADTIEHGGIEDGWDVLDIMAERQTILVPTLAFYFWAGEGLGSLGPAAVEAARIKLDKQLEMVRRAHEAGVPIALGTDTGSRFGVGENALEMALLVEAGLSTSAAIAAATRVAARALGWDDWLGTVEAGKIADLLVFDANPLDAIGPTRRCPAPPTTVFYAPNRSLPA
jgi:imidazolonepropionase-like amidohydrolase